MAATMAFWGRVPFTTADSTARRGPKNDETTGGNIQLAAGCAGERSQSYHGN